MGLCGRLFRFGVIYTIFITLLVMVPNIPPHANFTEFRAPPSRHLEGPLSTNNLLHHSEKLFEDEIKGPESFAVLDGELYTTLHGGYVAKIYEDQVVPVVKFGQPCDGWWEERKCGRPLGIVAGAGGHLLVADAYYGIFKHHVETGKTHQLVKPDDVVGNRKPKLFNGLDVAKDGTIYWTDSSSDFYLHDGIYSFLADPSGRLIRYDPKTKKNQVLMDGLHFPNGVILSHDEDFVLVAETAKNSIHRYYLAGPKKGTHDVFVDDLPGLPDGLRRNNKGGFIATLVLAKDPDTPVLAQALNPFPNIRKAVARTLALVELALEQIHSVYPNYYTARATHFVGHFEMSKAMCPLRVTVVEMDSTGKYTDSYHSTDGSVTGISDVILYNGYLYMGSPYNTYVARVKSSKLIAKLTGPSQATKPTTTAQKPTTTTPKPATTTAPKPTTTTPRPTTTTPRPTTTTPKPTTTTPKPATTTTAPKPTTTTQKPTTTTPRPTTTTPKPSTTTTTPKPTTTTSKPTTAAPKPTTTQKPTPEPKVTPSS